VVNACTAARTWVQSVAASFVWARKIDASNNLFVLQLTVGDSGSSRPFGALRMTPEFRAVKIRPGKA
jgi:hypothetical protein